MLFSEKHLNKNKNVLLISEFEHFLLDGLKEELNNKGVRTKHIFLGKLGKKSKLLFVIKIFYAFFYTILFSKKFNSVSYHYATKYIRLIDFAAKFKNMRRVCTVWGSEYAKANLVEREKLENWYCTLDELSVTNKNFVADLVRNGLKVHELSFGLSQFDYIDKLAAGVKFDNKKLTVIIGTNGSKNQQHITVINQILQLDNNCLSRFQFVIPMTYGGDPQYRAQVISLLASSNVNYRLIENSMSNKKLAQLRLSTDVLIQVQETDQLSGAMLESIYAGAHVITGNWLYYQELDSLNITWSKVEKVDEVGKVLSGLNKLTAAQKNINKIKIAEKYSWNARIDNWLKFLLEV